MILPHLADVRSLSDLGDLAAYISTQWWSALSGRLQMTLSKPSLAAGAGGRSDSALPGDDDFEEQVEADPVASASDPSFSIGADTMANALAPMKIKASGHQALAWFDFLSHSPGSQRAHVACKAPGDASNTLFVRPPSHMGGGLLDFVADP